METLEALFLNYYIPAANKSIHDTWVHLEKSKYRHLINLDKNSLKSNLYETIRLGYVALFHKYETFLNSVVETVNLVLKGVNNEINLLPIEKYCQKKYGVNVYKSHHLFPIVSKINYVANCVKHYDGKPIKEPIHSEFLTSSKFEKIDIDPAEFKQDIGRLKSHCNLFLPQLMTMGFKQFFELD